MASQLTPEDVGKLKVAELRAELKARDLSTAGLKKELADRLLEHLSGGAAASNGAEPGTAEQADQAQAAEAQEPPAAPETGTDVPETAVPSGDSTAQTSAEAAPIPASTEQAETDNLPGEMPVVPPVTEDSVDDFTGAEGTIAQETATEGVETVKEPSEVHRPPPDHLDKTPGFVADSRLEEAREKAETAPLNEPAVLPGDQEAGHKRKLDEVEEPAISAPESGISSVAEQAETAAPPNDEITADPAAASILNGSEPEAKRPRTDETATAPSDIPVPQSVTVEDVSSMPVDSTNVNGASSSTLPTSVIPSGGAPDVVTLNEPQKSATDFASADSAATDAVSAGQEIKSVPELPFDVQTSSSSSSNITPSAIDNVSQTHLANPTGLNNEKRNGAQGGPLSTFTSTHSLNIRGASNNISSSTNTKETNNQLKETVANETSSSSSFSHTKQNTTETVNLSQKPPISRSICISNLVRPFTLPALKGKVEDFGDVEYFWINSIKSHCFVTYTTTESAEKASSSLEGEIWPEAVGKALSVTYIPSEKIPALVEKEEAAGRTRLELVFHFDETRIEWVYDVIAPSATTGKSLGQAPPVPRGLASSMPLQARTGMLASGSGRLDPRNMITATTASGAPIQLPSNSAFAQSRPPTLRQTVPPFASTKDSDNQIWLPKSGSENLYTKTKTTPQLYFKAVDKVAAGRRLRQLEAGPPRPYERAPYRRDGGRPDPSSSFRDSYRP